MIRDDIYDLIHEESGPFIDERLAEKFKREEPLDSDELDTLKNFKKHLTGILPNFGYKWVERFIVEYLYHR